MQSESDKPHPVDARIILYRMAKQVAAIVAMVIALKLLILDIVPMHGSQMAPAIENSDHLLMLRLPYVPFMHLLGGRVRGDPVIFTLPFAKSLGCLRIAGVSGDSVGVEDGVFRNTKAFVKRIPSSDTIPRTEVMPAEFSPRDYCSPVRIPAPGDTIGIDSLDSYALCFAASVIRQENPRAKCKIIPRIVIDDTASTEYRIAEFAIYKGRLDSIPDSCGFDWFFWKRLNDYLQGSMRDHKVSLAFEFFMNGTKMTRYAVKNKFLFLLADNWNKGFDSRYFGPVIASSIIGRPYFILWSFSTNEGTKGRLNLRRLGRFIR
jgi:hypothetical protein